MREAPFISIILVLALLPDRVCAQPTAEPHVRWLAGGTILGPNLVAFSVDGSSVYTHGAADLGLKKWDFASRQLVSLTPVPAGFTSTAGLSHDQQRVAFSTSQAGQLSLCRVEDGSVLWSDTVNSSAPALTFSTDDSLLLSLGYPGLLQVWQVANGDPLGTTFADSLGNQTNAFRWADFLNDVEFLALANGEAIRFDAETGGAAWRTLDPVLSSSWIAAVSPDRTEFCVLTTNGLQRYSTSTGEKIADVYAPTANVSALAYTPDGETLAVALQDNGVELRDLTNGLLQRTLGGLPESEWVINTMAWSPDGASLVAGGVYGSYIWSLPGTTNAEPFIPLALAHRTPARFSRDARWIVKGSWPDDVVLLDATNGAVAHRWTLQSKADVERACPSPVSDTVFVPTTDGDLQIRSLPDGALLSTVNLFTNGDRRLDLEFSMDGSHLLAFDDNLSPAFAVFSTNTWQALRAEAVPTAVHARITPDGSHVLTSGSGQTLVWSVSNNLPPLSIPGSGLLEFGPTPEEFWTLGQTGWIEHWLWTDGTRLGGVKIPVTNYNAVLSPDRRLILTSQSGHQPLKIWRTDNGRLIGQLGGPAAVQLLRFTSAPEHRWLVATRRDGSLVAFDFPFFVQLPDMSSGQLQLRVVGAPGPFQLESSTRLNAGWEALGDPFEDETAVPFSTEAERYFRVNR